MSDLSRDEGQAAREKPLYQLHVQENIESQEREKIRNAEKKVKKETNTMLPCLSGLSVPTVPGAVTERKIKSRDGDSDLEIREKVIYK